MPMLKTTKTLLSLIICLVTLNFIIAKNELVQISESGQAPKNTAIDFSLSPNPVKNNKVEVTFTEPINTNIYIHDNLGDIVYKISTENKKKVKLTLNDLYAGIYFISVKTEEKTIIKRLIKY